MLSNLSTSYAQAVDNKPLGVSVMHRLWSYIRLETVDN